MTEVFGCDYHTFMQGNSQWTLDLFCVEKPEVKAAHVVHLEQAKQIKTRSTPDMFM